MKVNNFSELDKVLKKSFFNIKDEVSKFKKLQEKQYKDFEKKNNKNVDVLNTKIKFVSQEIKNVKNLKNELTNVQKETLKGLTESHNEQKKELKNDFDSEILKLKQDTGKLKDNFVKVMDLLKEKLVTKQAFEQNNEVIEKAITELIEKTKDLDQIKFTYFSKLNLNRQMNNLKEDSKELKEEFYKSKDIVEELLKTKEQFLEFKETSSNNFVKHEELSDKLKDFVNVKELVEELNQKVNHFSEQTGGSVDLNLFNNEIEDIRRRLSMISEMDEKFNGLVTKEELQSNESKIDELTQKHEELLNQIISLKEVVQENNDLKQEIKDLKKELSKNELQIEKNSALIEMVRDTNSDVKVKQIEEKVKEIEEKEILSKKVEQSEQIPIEEKLQELDYQPLSEIQDDEESGLLKRTLKGIADFFLEEDEELLNFEAIEEVKKEYAPNLGTEQTVTYTPLQQETSLSDTKFVAEIEKMFENEPQSPQIDIQLDDNGIGDNFLNKIKKGVVNFFFEEADDDEFIFQSEEIEKEDEIELEDRQESVEEIVEIQEVNSEKVEKTSEEQFEPEVKEKKSKKDQKANRESKKKGYMKSKRPRIFKDVEKQETEEAELEEVTGNKKNQAGAASLAEEDYVYYPEDYFY